MSLQKDPQAKVASTEKTIHISNFDEASNYAENYLRTFYMEDPVPDDQALMKFIAKEYAQFKGSPILLEIGCGPVINHVLSAAPYVSQIHMADYRDDNLNEIRKWCVRDKAAHDWTRFMKFALEAEGGQATDELIKTREEETRKKISVISRCDLRNELPFGVPRTYTAVSCFYTTGQASSTREEWQEVFKNLASLVGPQGYFLCCAVGYTEYYVIYDRFGRSHEYKIPRLVPQDFESALVRYGFEPTASRVTYQPLEGQESEGVVGVILVSARKK